MNVSRRNFILALTGGASVAAISGFVLRRPLKSTLVSAYDSITPAAKRLREEFPYLTLGEGAIERYLADWERHNGSGANSGFRRDGMFFQRFLMSTDFFQNDQRLDRTVEYALYYDPYVTPCYNPLLPHFRVAAPAT